MKKITNHTGWIKSLLSFFLLFVPQIFGGIFLLLLGFDLSKMSEGNIDLNMMITLEYSMIFTMGIMLWLFMKFIDKQPLIEIGLETKGRLKEFNYGIILGLLIMAFAYVFLYLIGEIVFKNYNFDLQKIFLSIVLFMGVSIFEEVIFRGYMLKNLLESFNPYVALFISSIFFSLIHGSNPNVTTLGLCNIFLAGFFLGASYIFTKNLWFPIALHFSWNFFQSMFGFKVSGLDSYSIIDFSIPENNLLNGGEFGFESSFLSIIILIIGTFIIWNYFKKNHLEKS
ncbi:MAG: CPBP family intramembrane metalloprotease [Flavobacteriaceae bacterium]|nr:CPBP family intramembrane metalloprotease [Flavobacteriaceae bacterium]|tara:strand:+ start:3513 stop:4361 length:849 start_codon:yes stop_codon:yes gene_type:complete